MKANSRIILLAILFLSGLPSSALAALSNETPCRAVEASSAASSGLAVPLFHGIHIRVSVRSGIHIVRATYEGGTPVADGDILITAPGSEEAWQVGRTDPAGQFAFLPDAVGTWIIQVDDGRGHRARTTLEVEAGQVAALSEGVIPAQDEVAVIHTHEDEADPGHTHQPEEGTTGPREQAQASPGPSPEHTGAAAATPTNPRGVASQGEERLWKLLTGLGFIAGITGIAYGYTARRKGAGSG